MRPLLLIPLLAIFSFAAAAERAPIDSPATSELFEKVLIPVTTWGPGAFGSLWLTTILVHNPGETGVEVGHPVFTNPACLMPCGCPETNVIEPQETLIVTNCQVQSHPAGMLVYVPLARDEQEPELDFHVSVRDMSRDAEDWGVQVPVVRESDFASSSFRILNVPTDPRYRLTLRVYAPDREPYAAVNVRVYHPFLNDLLGEIGFDVEPEGDATALPLRPGFAQIDLRSIPRISEVSSVRVEIVPATPITSPPTPTPRMWAMVSVTNNDTQRATIIAPE